MQSLLADGVKNGLSPQLILDKSVKTWFVTALFGQWMFALYILILYVMPTIAGNSEVTHNLLPGQGVQDKRVFDGVVFFSHVVPAIILALCGISQLVPTIRNNYPRFHRINGRIFFILGISGAVTGLYLTWVTGMRFSDIGSMGITLNGILIPTFIYFAWRTACKKQFNLHQRFAVHSFLLVNGVWTFRLYLMGWFVVNQGPLGNSRNLDGPADIAMSFACYLLPMFIAELVFWAKRANNLAVKWLVAFVSVFGAAITLIGVGAATMMMWLPRIDKVFNALF
ncbi:DUF2306 domain-containing protein [Pseudoalteromonas spongiae]|uniref:DUF2306 domain-containing protein n=1 Tax=Pseudoalteromonas spongiae TaxID=298657 RepID=A0ABU8EXS9_9GAMM